MSGKYARKPSRKSKWLAYSLVALGAVLLVAALFLVGLNRIQVLKAEKAAQAALSALETAPGPTQPLPQTTVPETSAPVETTEVTEATDPTDPITLSSEFLDGHEYVGYLEFPSLDRKLPVMKIKYVEDLQIAPCLEKGSPHDDDAVIAAHNYPSHFGPIRDWTGGEEVIFTDLEDHTIHYTVQLVEKISPYDVEKVMESEYDLVLYTCTPGGANRVMVACNRTETE